MQNQRLADFFRHQLPYSPFYRQRFQQHFLSFDSIQSVEDLRKVPFTTKEDIAPTLEQPARPRDLILQPDERSIRRVASLSTKLQLLRKKVMQKDVRADLEYEYKPIHTHFTTGRTALPTPFVYSARDIEYLKETGKRAFLMTGASKNDVAVNGFPYAPHLAFWMAFFALNHVGMTSLQTGGGKTMGTEKIINAIERLKANVVTMIPGYAYHLLREAVKQHRDFSNLRFLIFGGERVSDGLRSKVRAFLEDLGSLDAKILTTYAFTEAKTAWMQCSEKSGYHLNPDMEVIEIVDEAGEPVLENQPGEIVYTGINWRGSVVVRYRTGDITKGMIWTPCPHCGRNLPRLHPDIQRKSEFREFRLTNVKGQLVNLNALYPLLSGMKQIEEWQVIIRKKDGDAFGLDEMVVRLTPKEPAKYEDLAEEVRRAVRSEMELTPTIEFVELKQILQDLGMESEMKEKRILDQRKP